ncbi:MAG TPA: hypothetical protein PL070_01285 [Flavobacteriales bacterium]|nr:hypothetical protein [Flavobacteriales bacterium]
MESTSTNGKDHSGLEDLKDGHKRYIKRVANDLRKDFKDITKDIEAYRNDLLLGTSGSPSFKKILDSLIARAQSFTNGIEERDAAISNFEKALFGDEDEGTEGYKDQIEAAHSEIEKRNTEASAWHSSLAQYHEEVFGSEEKKDGLKKEFLALRDSMRTSLDEWKKQSEALRNEIRALLPGAAAVGLAKAYADQKDGYNWPIALWASGFVGTMVFMIWFGVNHLGSDPATLEEAFRRLLSRLPVVGFAIWLGAYTGKKLSQNIRLQQEYAHRQSQAQTYVGFRQEVERLEEEGIDVELRELLLRTMVEGGGKNPSETLDKKSNDEKGPFGELLERFFARKKTSEANEPQTEEK